MTRLTVLGFLAWLPCLSTAAREQRFLLEERNYPPVNITQATYKAAVYNSDPFMTFVGMAPTRELALQRINKNLDDFERQATIAEQQNVDIMVFSEYGITFGMFTRQSMKPFLETIPDPTKVKWNPCLQPTLYNDTETQQRLSCMARNHSLYIVANMGDIQPCVSDTSCPADGSFQYNTDVVFDPNGLLIARYHKQHLFGEEDYFDSAPTELVTFDTPFGRFAVFTCFDSIYKDPAVSVIEKYNVDSVAFPTLWSDTPPLFKGFEWQAAFAAGMKVNFLASNLYRAGGSGIYTPTGPAVYVTNRKPVQLLIATIPSRPVEFPNSVEAPIPRNTTSDENLFHSNLFRDIVNSVQLKGRNGTATVCSGTFCCQVEFSRTDDSGVFALSAFSGLHTFVARGEVQVCAVMKCPGTNTNSCGTLDINSSIHFTSLVMKGSFTTKYVFPEILVEHSYEPVLPEKEWSFSNRVLRSNHGFSKPLLSAILFGRDYSKE